MRQPFPDKYRTWITIEASGYRGSGAGSLPFSYNFALNYLTLPFNVGGGVTQTLLNPVIANASNQAAGLQNILYNSSTGTGIWQLYRVWRVKVAVTTTVATLNGGVNQCLISAGAPVLGQSNSYGTAQAVGSAPEGKYKIITSGTSGKENTLYFDFSMPELFGMPASQFQAYTPAAYAYATSAGALTQIFQHTLQASDQTTASAANIGIMIKMQFFVEFFNRVDTNLLGI